MKIRLPFEDSFPWSIGNLPATPFYAIDKNCLVDLFDQAEKFLLKANSDFRIHYAVKANHNAQLLDFFKTKGCGLDIVSGGEFDWAVKNGFTPAKDLVFSGVGKTRDEIQRALQADCFLMNVESLGELERILEISKTHGKKAQIGCRVNPDVDPQTHPYISTGLKTHKFGVNFDQALEVFTMIKNNPNHLAPRGLSLHIGSQIQNLSVFEEAFEKTFQFGESLYRMGIEIEILDLGGGLGIDYSDLQKAPRFEEYGQIVARISKKWKSLTRGKGRVICELGRCLIAQAGTLVTQVIGTKVASSSKQFLIVDASMTELLRPALYQARHPIKILNSNSDANPSNRMAQWEVVGPVCESSDSFGEDFLLPADLKEGDVLGIFGAGAYGSVMSNQYNLRPLPQELFIG